MRPLYQVQGWLSRVQNVKIQVDQLTTDGSQEIRKLCLGGHCCKNCRSSFKFGRKVVKMLQLVDSLKSEGDFKDVAERIPDDRVDERPIEPTIGLESTFDRVWRSIGEEEVGIIGLYGMGGVGKTTLLTQVNNKIVNSLHSFDVVIWVLVSKDPQLEKIQENIGKKIGAVDESWKYNIFEEKATKIFKILRKKKFVLLLDDIWDWFNLTEVGIPLPGPENASKIVFTTRSIDVCNQMGADKKIEVQCLAHEKAWELFQEKVGRDILDLHPNIPKLADIVVKECGGLPLALIIIGRAMASKKTPEEWKHAIKVLRTYASKFSGMENKVYSRLKFSYDSLPDSVSRACLLYCSLYPKSYSITKRDLIDCWIGERFLDECENNGALNQGYYIIGVLLDACLFEDEENDFIKMHDVVRDMILWIARQNNEFEKKNLAGENSEIEERAFLVCTGSGLTEVPEIRKWQGMRRVSLMKNQIKNLSKTPKCPHLLTLFLSFNRLETITSNFFHFMPSLTVLNLSNNLSLKELPSGISKLVSLRHLDVSETHIEELPKELKVLVNLRYLNLEHTHYLHTIPPELICSFSMLCVLRMFKCGFLIHAEDCEFLIEELLLLEHVNVLTISLKSSHALQRILSSSNLQECTQSLFLRQLDNPLPLEVLSLSDMKNLNGLHLHECGILDELKTEYAWKVQYVQESFGFHNLHTVDINSCCNLMDLTWLILVPNLKLIKILYCFELKEIISAEKLDGLPETMRNPNPFAKLEFLELGALEYLSSIYSNPLPFPQLKEIIVYNCPRLKKLSLDSNSATGGKNVTIRAEEDWWKELMWEDEATQNAFLPGFVRIGYESDYDLESGVSGPDHDSEAEPEIGR